MTRCMAEVTEYILMDVNGKGHLSCPNIFVFDGYWKDDKMHAQGLYTWIPDGAVYEGDWKYGDMHGKGRKTYSNGCEYSGYWQNNKRNGKGRLNCSTGTVPLSLRVFVVFSFLLLIIEQ